LAARRLLTEQMWGKIKVRRSERVEGDHVRMLFLLSCRLCGKFSTTSVAQMARHLEGHPKPTLRQRAKCKMGLN
jgi:hypothetical protein